jgi:hypothetical protein
VLKSLLDSKLNREVGLKPTRSRHCKWEQPTDVTVERWEDVGSNDHEPGNLPVFDNNSLRG